MTNLEAFGVTAESLDVDPTAVGLTDADLAGKSDEQIGELVRGERLFQLSRAAGEAAYSNLFHAQWGFGSPCWFDHRLHVLGPAVEWTDFFAMSADNVIGVLPLDGSVLSLCAGDCFYERWWYARRATEVHCVDNNPDCHRHFIRLHQMPETITYYLADVLTFQAPADHYDVVVIRGAIEHFSQADQQRIFKLAHAAMKPGGWFCGDTPAARDTGAKMLDAHEFEWRDADQMRTELARVFGHVETQTLVSRERTTLFWRARR